MHCANGVKIQLFTCSLSAVSPKRSGNSYMRSQTALPKKSSTFEILIPINFYFPLQYETYSEEISLLVTVTNYCIWRTRLEQLNVDPHTYSSYCINSKTILAKLFSYFRNRTKKQKKIADTTFVKTMENIGHHLSKKLQDLV